MGVKASMHNARHKTGHDFYPINGSVRQSLGRILWHWPRFCFVCVVRVALASIGLPIPFSTDVQMTKQQTQTK